MKAVTAAAVATASVASNISYAQPTLLPDIPATLPTGLRYAQQEDASQIAPTLKSRVNSARHAGSPTSRSVSLKGGEDVTQMISMPKVPIDFAHNLKAIFDCNLLLQDSFYTEANLKDIFSLEKVDIDSSVKDSEGNISISGSVSESIFPRIKTSEFFGGSAAGAQFGGGKTTHQSGMITAALNFGMYEGGPNFDETERIFAKKFVRVPSQPSPHGEPVAATAPHGNETWRYQQVDGQNDKTITVGFNSAGELSRVLIEFKNE